MFEQVLNEVVPEYKDRIQMYKVDIEDEVDLAIQFGARGVPYMVFISKDCGCQSMCKCKDGDCDE